jgi:pyruvate formate lyase activating enzyme
VTFSGGEPLMQAAFVAEVIDQLNDIHVLLDTSGYGTEQAFRQLASKADLLHFDLKIIDPDRSQRYTGVDPAMILRNLRMLPLIGKPFVIRVPLVPTVTDTDENLAAIADTVRDIAGLVRVELLPYNHAAGGKYEAAGMTFDVDYDESAEVSANVGIFTERGIDAKVT